MVCNEGAERFGPSFFLFAAQAADFSRESEKQGVIGSMTDIANHEYEVVFVARPNLGDEGVSALNGRLAQLVATQSGAVTGSEVWGKRTLAYPIGKFFEGVYVLNRISMLPRGAAEVDRLLHFNEDVLRYMIVRTDD